MMLMNKALTVHALCSAISVVEVWYYRAPEPMVVLVRAGVVYRAIKDERKMAVRAVSWQVCLS